MMQRLWRRICPHCLRDPEPLHEHPALKTMRRTERRIDSLLDLLLRDENLDRRPSGNDLRDLTIGVRGEQR
jgi:hypothetical protein